MAVEITVKARAKLKELIEAGWKDKKVYLRMGVKGGGCSGLSYSLELCDAEKDPTDEKKDKVFEFPEVTAVVDTKSYLYINGSTLDYAEEGLTGGFTFINPKAKSSCGCGHSFSI